MVGSTIRFPGESQEYRDRRDELLQAEIELRKKTEEVAALRRALPLGGEISKDYVFERASDNAKIPISQMFGKPDKSLLVYSMMWGPDCETPCSHCNAFLDSLDGLAPHLMQQANFVVEAKAPASRVKAWAEKRGWTQLPLFSSFNNSFNADYHAEKEGANGGYQQGQMPMANVFRLVAENGTDPTVHHTWGAEMLYSESDQGQDARHVDSLSGIWNWFDLTAEGRPGYFLKLEYD
eukprot:CAMPEP_0198335156 /NCGR_PEP_ID=MMETSP1450-20131203/20117_1 /TAXON_ID=753684 ORGANISM="Madagascaria erythrocladiodes, Strain CCMP3234" /NCGR_SAMPLE_ID=MMETSP1450 /ASSEMBLY_ACC=CAM_ASM_001115 /LENGTH=235 /DNA_ID=CAMNT_0044039799 /DNA_START=221 /DNA_END=928 /DNA_ORIENTATION=-